jgi:hypothetical protein
MDTFVLVVISYGIAIVGLGYYRLSKNSKGLVHIAALTAWVSLAAAGAISQGRTTDPNLPFFLVLLNAVTSTGLGLLIAGVGHDRDENKRRAWSDSGEI